MKKYILCAITMLAAFTMQAGDTLYHRTTHDSIKWFRKLHFGLNAGIALPMNALASKAANNSSDSGKVANGYANMGYHIDFTVSYPVWWKLGVIAYAGYNMNAFDATTYKKANGVATFTAKNYTAWQYLGGPYFAMPLGNKFSVNARVMAGFITLNYPSQTTNSTSNTTAQWFNITGFSLQTETSTINGATEVSGTNGKGFGYSFGVGGEYKLGKKTALALNVGYTGSTITYSSLTYFTNNVTNYQNKPNIATGIGTAGTTGTSTTTAERKFSNAAMSMAILTASLGITYHL
jgi:hypothetical protein